jgi:hypothetical protein
LGYINLEAQDFFILNVKGIIKSGSTGKELKTRDVIKSEEKLIFSSPNDVLAVIHPNLGRFMVKPVKSEATSELIGYVKDVTNQNKKLSSKMSARPSFKRTEIEFLGYKLSGRFLLLPEMNFESEDCCLLTDTSYFLMKYRFAGNNVIKRLAQSEQVFTINTKDLLTVEGKVIAFHSAYEPTLYFFDGVNEQIVRELYFNEVELDQVKNEVDLMMSVLNADSTSNVKGDAIKYINETYGRINPSDFERWFVNLK